MYFYIYPHLHIAKSIGRCRKWPEPDIPANIRLCNLPCPYLSISTTNTHNKYYLHTYSHPTHGVTHTTLHCTPAKWALSSQSVFIAVYEGIICVSPESGEWRESHLVLSRNALLEIGSFRDGEWRTKEYYSEHWTLIQEQLSLGGQFFWEISDPLGELDIKEVVTFGIKVSIHETSGNSRNYNSIWVTRVLSLLKKTSHLASFVKCIKSYKSFIFLNNEII